MQLTAIKIYYWQAFSTPIDLLTCQNHYSTIPFIIFSEVIMISTITMKQLSPQVNLKINFS